MTYQPKLPLEWETERLAMTNSVPSEITELQAVHDACAYLAKWDGEYTQSDNHLHELITDPPMPPNGGERERFRIQTLREKTTSQIVGFLAWYEGLDAEDTLYVFTFFIHPDYQSKGFGREVMSRFFEYVKQAGFRRVLLCTALKNFPAVRFWTGLGVNRIVKVHGDRVCSETTHAQVDMEMVF